MKLKTPHTGVQCTPDPIGARAIETDEGHVPRSKRLIDTKILLTAVDLNKSGGVASYYKGLLPHLGMGVDILTVGARSDDEPRLLRLWRIGSDLFLLCSRLLRKDYDLVHVNPSLDLKAIVRDSLVIIVARLFRKRVVAYIFGWSPGFEMAIDRYLRPLVRVSLFKASCIVVQSSQYKQKIQEWGYKKPIYVETGIVDATLIEGVSEESILEKSLRRDGMTSMLFLARVERKKGIYETLDALQILQGKLENIHLTIAGSGSELENVRRHVVNHGLQNVAILGHITGEQRRQAYLDSDIYVLPTSHGEGMPSSVLEAMACGLPVVTRPVGGIRDFFEDQKMGCLMQSTDPQELAQIIEDLVARNERTKEISLYNHRYAKSHFLASKVAGRIEDIYDEVMELNEQ